MRRPGVERSARRNLSGAKRTDVGKSLDSLVRRNEGEARKCLGRDRHCLLGFEVFKEDCVIVMWVPKNKSLATSLCTPL